MRISVSVRPFLFLLAFLAVSCAGDPSVPVASPNPADPASRTDEPSVAEGSSELMVEPVAEPGADYVDASQPRIEDVPADANVLATTGDAAPPRDAAVSSDALPFSVEPETVFTSASGATDATPSGSDDASEVMSETESNPAPAVPPKPATSVTPKPATAVTPKPANTVTPKPATTVTPKPATAVTPKSATTVTPKPGTAVTPKPATTVTPKPATTVTPKLPAAAAVASESADEERALPEIWEAGVERPSLEPPSVKERQAPSRTATIPEGHTLEVWYPGTGWVYLGDASAQNGLSYETRKLDRADTLFAFRAAKQGTFLLEFSRYDVVSDEFVSDVLAVTVSPPVTTRTGRLRAPDWRSAKDGEAASERSSGLGTDVPAMAGTAVDASPVMIDEPALVASGNQPAATPSASTDSTRTPGLLLEDARAALAKGDAGRALSTLDSFFAVAVESLDEGWFLRGQAYEANGATRDVRKALAAYETVVRAWPESERWKDADTRIRYLKSFYLRGR